MNTEFMAAMPTHTAFEALDLMRRGDLNASDYLKSCLKVVDQKEPIIKALAFIDKQYAMTSATEQNLNNSNGVLSGIPIVIKDVIDVANMPTAYGAAESFTNIPSRDAACVALLKQAGAVIAGKSTTAEFAYSLPPATVNPHNILYTPGGSSSGSAAAVAAGMFPVTIGTQTGGSMIRPASFCGVYGFKPTFNIVPRDGVKTFAESSDTIGWFTSSLKDTSLVLKALAPAHSVPNVVDTKLRVAVCKTPFWAQADNEMRAMVLNAAESLGATEIDITDIASQASYDHRLLMASEISRSLLVQFKDNYENLSPGLVSLIKEGFSISRLEELAAHQRLAVYRRKLDDIFDAYDVIITPAAPGPALKNHEKTGSSIFNILWSASHAPCLSLPVGTSKSGLPLGLQCISRRFNDANLLVYAAKMIEEIEQNNQTRLII